MNINQETRQLCTFLVTEIFNFIPENYRADFQSRLTSFVPGIDMTEVRAGDREGWQAGIAPKVVDHLVAKFTPGQLKQTA